VIGQPTLFTGAVPHDSDPALLTLHAVRLLGMATPGEVARRYGLGRDEVGELLLDLEAWGHVSRSEFAGSGGWSLTERGRAEDERQLAAELEAAGAREVVSGVHEEFVPLNARFQDAATHWQVRPLPGAPMAANDHTDHRWDDRVIDTIAAVARRLAPLDDALSQALTRFGGYAARYGAAADRVVRGEGRWVDGLGIDSCHVVWIQLHEDLLATLGLARGEGP
jgi:hypothetical protein